MSGALVWLDLRVEGDPHPRRFDGPETLRAYLSRFERLPEAAIDELLASGEVGPPTARRVYRVQLLRP